MRYAINSLVTYNLQSALHGILLNAVKYHSGKTNLRCFLGNCVMANFAIDLTSQSGDSMMLLRLASPLPPAQRQKAESY
jgi:hypothetical protein